MDNGATVTVTNVSTGLYKAAVTLPAVADGDTLQLRVTATVGGVTEEGFVWAGQGVTARQSGDAYAVVNNGTYGNSALKTAIAGVPAATEAAILNEGDATALLAAIAAKVEEFLVNDGDATATLQAIATAVWANATRSLTDKTGFSLTQSFPANFAALAITATTGRVTVGTNNDKTGYSISGTKTTLDTLNDITAAAVVSALGTGSTLTTLATAAGLSSLQTHGDSTWITATGFAVAGDAMALTAAERAAVADKLIGRRISGGADGGRTVGQALAASRNKVVRSGNTLTVYDVDDTTVLWTATITTDAAAELLTGVDPA